MHESPDSLTTLEQLREFPARTEYFDAGAQHPQVGGYELTLSGAALGRPSAPELLNAVDPVLFGSRAFTIPSGDTPQHTTPEKQTVLVVEPMKEPIY